MNTNRTNKNSKHRNGKLNKDLMKKDIQIVTEVLEVRKDEMKVRTILVIIRDSGLRSTHTEVRWVRHFGDWTAPSETVHNRLTESAQKWVETGVKGPELLEYGLD